jgi:Ni2+-binding GTPase involved in maturation of urease and hydrogenase
MKLITVSGPPSSGKTSVILKTVEILKKQNIKIGVIKFDCLNSCDDEIYNSKGIPVKVGLSSNLCPDHFFITNIEDALQWGKRMEFDILISESAGLCNRCSPHIKNVLAVCVIDNLSGINTPKKIGPMLKFADIVVVTKGDIVSQAEREVFISRIKAVNPMSKIIVVNGITGQGAFKLSKFFENETDIETLNENYLRFSMPSALCSYCIGQTRIGSEHEMGSVRKIDFSEV